MIINYQKFDFEDKCIIEKAIILAPFRQAFRFHNEACFIYFLEGKTTINSAYAQTGIEAEQAILLKCGSYFADLIKYSNAERYEILVVHLYPEMLRQIYKHELPSFLKPSVNKSFVNKIVPHGVITKFIESLYFYFDNPQLVSDELLKLKIKELILILVQTKNAESIQELFADLFTPRTVNIKELVGTHLFSGLPIEDMAKLANMSVSTFNRTFHSLFNDSPANYIKIKRLERAKDLLAMSSLTISEIAFQTCFHDVAHLSRAFRTAYHCTPSYYRASIKESSTGA